ncbi:MAG: DUF1206 domain-containing protein [Leptolyngbyaceae cyanobacterium SL_1_1]|nr:DUF1206 domain-containing protein [Leptolyngbyaceae cyanobacterium RM1_1_2]NJO08589.1 DUF1206 domain-containing protein [Leptolyngbyaceae cyanobacterium SL_1_1]
MNSKQADWIVTASRVGIAVKGIVYALIGVLAAQAALGIGGKTSDTQGALATVLNQPFGQFMLILIAAGLLGYAIYRFAESLLDIENKGTDGKGLIQRLGYFSSGIVYSGLAVSAVRLVMGSGSSSGGSSTQDWTAKLMSQPFGQWLVATAGVIALGVAGYHFYQAFSAKFRQHLNWSEMSDTERTWAVRLGRIGHTARGVTFVIIGGFLIKAAITANPEEARGLSGALQTLQQQAYGPWLLGLVALGLIAYGVYLEAKARYRRIRVD